MEIFLLLGGFVLGLIIGVGIVADSVAQCNMVELFKLRKALNAGDFDEAIDYLFIDNK